MADLDISFVQRFLNAFRAARKGDLKPIPESDEWDAPTVKALRAFQHEHNSFHGERILVECGIIDADTRGAIAWWSEVLGVSDQKAVA